MTAARHSSPPKSNAEGLSPPASAIARDLTDYVAAVAAGAPTPGGGSVVAVVAALGAALAEMVANLTSAHPGEDRRESEFRRALASATDLRTRLLRLAAADEAAYGRYATAAARPRATDAEKATRRAAMQAALVSAADVPLAVADACVALAEALEPIARLGNKHVLADAAIGAHLARAALHGSLFNVRGNARLMTDQAQSASYLRRAAEAEEQGETALGRVAAALSARDP